MTRKVLLSRAEVAQALGLGLTKTWELLVVGRSSRYSLDALAVYRSRPWTPMSPLREQQPINEG